jgi:hypothetical protein
MSWRGDLLSAARGISTTLMRQCRRVRLTRVRTLRERPTLLGRLTAPRAALLDNLDAAISSRLAAAGYTAPDNATIALIAGYVDELETRLTTTRAALLDNLDAAVSSRAVAGDAMGLTAGAVDAIWDEVLELTYTPRAS